jgi:hypothetical protein
VLIGGHCADPLRYDGSLRKDRSVVAAKAVDEEII